MAQPTRYSIAITVVAMAVLVTLGGCAGEQPDPPSLMARPVEKGSLEEPPARPIVYAPLPASARARAETLVARVDAAVAASRRITPRGRVAAPRGSDAWIDAATVTSAAQAALIGADGALVELDQLVADTAAAREATDTLVRIRDAALRRVRQQQARLDAVTPR